MALTRFESPTGNTPFSSLSQWIAGINSNNKAGYALPNRFEVLIPYPAKHGATTIYNPAHGSERKSDPLEISLRCESVNLPGLNLNTLTDSNIYGPSREIVDGVTYAEDIAMTFIASAGLEERVFFEEWQKQAFNPVTWDIGYYKDYVSDISLYLLDRKDRRRYGIKLCESFPKTIVATDLNQGANNEIIKISVSFAFRYWETLDKDRISPSTQSRAIEAETVTQNINRNLPAVDRLVPAGRPF